MENNLKAIYTMLDKEFNYKNTEAGILVTIKTAKGKEDVSLKSERFYSIVANKYRQTHSEIVSASKIKNCVLSYQGNILEQHDKTKNPNRCDRGNDNSIRIDIGNYADEYFEISSTGLQLKPNACEHFYKHCRKGQLPQPDMTHADIEKVFKYCRVPNDMKNVFIAYLVSLFVGNIEHPCLVINGKQGTGKTTMCMLIKTLIDPVGDNYPTLFPANDRDLALLFKENYLLAFDNLQNLSTKISDTLCSYVTGIRESRRVLYTTDEMAYYDICQPIILNGIEKIVTREDILSRSIVINLENAPERKNGCIDKISLVDEFTNDIPCILGGIIKLLIKALANYKPNTVSTMGMDIRMKSFYEYGYYICEALKKGQGAEFCAEYISLLENQLKEFPKKDEFIENIKMFLEEEEGFQWQGTMAQLSNELNEYVDGTDFYVPRSANRLSRELRKQRANLEDNGVFVEFSKTLKNSSYVRLSLEDV